MKPPRRIPTSVVAFMLGVHPSSVRRWAERGVLGFLRTPGGKLRFDRVEVEEFAASRLSLPSRQH